MQRTEDDVEATQPPAATRRRGPRTAVLVLAAVTVTIVALAVSRSHDSAAAAPSNAQHLADLDGGTHPASDYQAELDILGYKCTQDEAGIAALADTGYIDLETHGISDETRLTVLLHMSLSIPAGSPKMDCQGVLSAYLVLREG